MLRYISIAILIGIITSCVETEFVEIDRILIEPDVDSVVLFPGQTFEIEAIFINSQDVPQDVELIWTTANPNVASVAASGKTITAIAPGETNLEISFGNEESSTLVENKDFKIIVVRDPDLAGTITILSSSGSADESTIVVGNNEQLVASVVDGNGNEIEDPELLWTSEDEEIVTVDQNGNVTGISTGRANIVVGSDGIVSKFSINVVPNPTTATEIIIEPPSNSEGGNGILVGGQKMLDVTVLNGLGEEIEDPVLSWNSSNPSIATVDNNGIVSGVSTGQVIITAEKDDVVSSEFLLNVVASEQDVSNIQFEGIEEQLEINDIGIITAQAFNISGEELDVDLVFNSTNPSVISIDSNGNFTALSVGESSVSVSSDNATSQSLTVTVIDPNLPVSITLDAPVNMVTEGETIQLSFEAFNVVDELINPAVVWSSSNENLATVNQNGLVSGLEEGIVTITVTSVDDVNVSASVAIMVVGNNSRAATFVGVNGYRASGSVMLVDEGGEINLVFGNDFSVQNGPGLFLFVSNSPNGRTSVSQGLQVIEDRITSSDILRGNTFSLSDVNPNANLDSYSHVLIICVPFGNLPFGIAEFPEE